MGPREAVYAINNFLPNIERVIPMHFAGSLDILTGTPEDFEKQLTDSGSKVKMVHPKTFLGGSALVEWKIIISFKKILIN